MFKRVSPVVLGATMFLALGAHNGTDGPEPVAISIITCPASGSESSTASAALSVGSSRIFAPIALKHPNSLTYTALLLLAPGHYALAVKDGACTAGATVTVIKDHGRHRGTILKQYKNTYDYTAYLAGSLPIAGVSRAYVVDGARLVAPLVLDTGAYYGEDLPTGIFTLVLEFGELGLECRTPVTIKSPGTLYDIDPKTVVKTLGIKTKVVGEPATFRLLWP